MVELECFVLLKSEDTLVWTVLASNSRDSTEKRRAAFIPLFQIVGDRH